MWDAYRKTANPVCIQGGVKLLRTDVYRKTTNPVGIQGGVKPLRWDLYRSRAVTHASWRHTCGIYRGKR